jgi:hypothetical protein
VFGYRIAAGVWAFLVFVTIVYVTVRQRRDRSIFARAERGSWVLREELDAEDNP